MMRSLFSGVSGLKAHQTKLDVIGNNIANVNTTGFRASTVTFSDVFYQTSQSASGPNATTGTAGRNAMQIGLGTDMASISVNLTGEGSTQRTDRNLDLMINGDAFFVVNNNGRQCFTKAGNMDIDASGTLYCKTNGATVLGWQVDALGNPIVDQVSPLRVMAPENLYIEPEATTQAHLTGNIDRKAQSVQSESEGFSIQIQFYDNLGEAYMAKFNLKAAENGQANADGEVAFNVTLADITSTTTKQSILTIREQGPTGELIYRMRTAEEGFPDIEWGGQVYAPDTFVADATTGKITLADPDAVEPTQVLFNLASGQFVSAGENGDGMSVNFLLNDAANPTTFPASGIDIDFSNLTMFDDKGAVTVKGLNGDADGYYTGRAAGSLDGISVADDGLITGTYTNGELRTLGKIAVATFANPSGLEALGGSLFAASMNSGEFDGIGEDIKATGGSLSPGSLEMSNVDLATEFTTMITTQRGFQANSRIITTSDTMLEELINLKR